MPSMQQRFAAGAIIFEEGSPGETLYIVEQGHVEIWTRRGEQRERLRLLGPGTLFGERAALSGRPRAASASAHTAAVLTALTSRQVRSRIEHADSVVQLLVQTLLGWRSGDAADPAALERMRLEVQLEQAIGDDDLTLRYQPIVDLGTGRVASMEALVRWDHPRLGPVDPQHFISLAEESRLISSIDAWVLERACRDTAVIRAAGARQTVSVNLSGRAVGQERTLLTLRDAVARHGLVPADLRLEVTETILVHPELAVPWLERCHQQGFSLVIDDFGTGFSGLSYLRRLPVHSLKIDQSFVRDLDHPHTRAIVAGTIGMARALGLSTVAEGIESADIAAQLAEMGCTYGQGYHFSPPVALPDLLDALLA